VEVGARVEVAGMGLAAIVGSRVGTAGTVREAVGSIGTVAVDSAGVCTVSCVPVGKEVDSISGRPGSEQALNTRMIIPTPKTAYHFAFMVIPFLRVIINSRMVLMMTKYQNGPYRNQTARTHSFDRPIKTILTVLFIDARRESLVPFPFLI
jgi:hypothetical protein